MLHVQIKVDDQEIGRIDIEKIRMHEDGTANYIANFGIERGGAVGIHNRQILFFPREKYNALALLLQALNTLEPNELLLEEDISQSEWDNPQPLEIERLRET